jgi:hypothetical protein
LHTALGFALTEHVTAHLDSALLDQLTDESAVVFQTDDPDYNAHELQQAIRARQADDRPDRPVTLIYVPVPDPPSVTGIDWTKAKVLARFIIKAEDLAAPASA